MDNGHEKINTDRQIPAMLLYLDREFITIQGSKQPAYIPPHWHRSIEISLVMEGIVELWINEEKYIINQDEFIFVNSGYVHQLKEVNYNKTAVMLVIISYDFLKKVYPDIDNVYFKLENGAKELGRIKKIYQEFKKYSKNPKPFDYIKINAYLYEIVHFLLTNCAEKNPQAEQKIKKINHTQKQILNYIEEHYKEELSLKNLAEKYNMSEEHFSRKFHQYFGISFKKYIDKYRIYRAFEDIIQSEKTMQYIALEHGFANVKSFLSQFKKEYGVTPYQYRKKYQKSRNDNF